MLQVQAIVTRKQQWLKAIALDSKTGLDPTDSGIKVRAAQGLDAASYFVTGYWIWSKIIENLAAIDYDYNDCEPLPLPSIPIWYCGGLSDWTAYFSNAASLRLATLLYKPAN